MKEMLFYGNKKSEYYNGILMRADKGLHESLLKMIDSLELNSNIKILDFGAGEGALSQRLKDAGYKNILSVDIDKDNFKADTKFIHLDFNNKNEIKDFIFSHKEKFDLVIGIEVIEHVESHYDYIRDLKELVKKDGYIVISTPNITSWLSRLYFLFTGRLHQFMDQDLSYGHVNPISLWQIKYIFKQENIKLEKVEEMGTLPRFYFTSFSVRQILINIFSLLFTPFMKGEKKYVWCITIVGKKVD